VLALSQKLLRKNRKGKRNANRLLILQGRRGKEKVSCRCCQKRPSWGGMDLSTGFQGRPLFYGLKLKRRIKGRGGGVGCS